VSKGKTTHCSGVAFSDRTLFRQAIIFTQMLSRRIYDTVDYRSTTRVLLKHKKIPGMNDQAPGLQAKPAQNLLAEPRIAHICRPLIAAASDSRYAVPTGGPHCLSRKGGNNWKWESERTAA